MRKMKGARALAVALSLAMMICGVIGGTMAWLVDKTPEVKNTFTYGDINIDLEETPTPDDDEDKTTNDYEMIPGGTITKDPKITVEAGNEACWLFVKLVKDGGANIYDENDTLVASYGFDDYLEYAIADGWSELTADKDGNPLTGIYYREVEKDTDDQDVTYGVLENDQVKVKGSVTKEMMNALDADANNTTYPTLTISGYAVQKDDNINSPELAWYVAENPTAELPAATPAT